MNIKGIEEAKIVAAQRYSLSLKKFVPLAGIVGIVCNNCHQEDDLPWVDEDLPDHINSLLALHTLGVPREL